MTEQTVVAEKKPKVLGKADVSIEIPAFTKTLMLLNPDSQKIQPCSWFWRRLPAEQRAAILAEHAAVTAEVNGHQLAEAAGPAEPVAIETPTKRSRRERRAELRSQRNGDAVKAAAQEPVSAQ